MAVLRLVLSCVFVLSCAFSVLSAQSTNLASGQDVESSSVRGSYKAQNAVDGIVSDESRWLADKNDRNGLIQINFEKPVDIGAIDVYSGYEDGSPAQEYDLAVKRVGKWQVPDPCRIRGNQDLINRIKVNAKSVTGIKLTLIRSGPGRIREIAVYSDANTPMGTGLKIKNQAMTVDRTKHQIALNQVGYDPGRSMRFTAPLTADGVEFVVKDVKSGVNVHQGTIHSGIGDFSNLKTENSGHYVIEISDDKLGSATSDPFLVDSELFETQFWQSAVDFLIDARAVVGTHPSAFGGCPWRDGTYYDAIIPSLVLFYLADPDLIATMPKQIDWNADKQRIESDGFKFDRKNPCSEGVMDAVRGYYQMSPPAPDAPDVVKLIHWGAGYYLQIPATKDPSGDPLGRKIHSQTLEQIAYILWAWPKLKKWLPESFYEQCRDLCLDHWELSGGLTIPELWQIASYQDDVGGNKKNPMGGKLHPYKGRHAPGHSIVPNLLMYEVAKRDGLSNPKRFLDAAVRQADWIVKNLDWNDPRTTKGHRMSEHRTITNLVWLLQKYPQDAPNGLRKKIEEWASVAVSRSNNMWDFRRYDMNQHWTIPKLNDVGNSLGFPAIAIAASWVVEDVQTKDRLQELAIASIDHVFGRNPQLAAAPSQPEKGFPEIERGWPRSHKHNVCARLELVRGSISALPGTEMYPFKPEGRFRHAEGWVNYGACWCLSLAYLKFDELKTTPEINR